MKPTGFRREHSAPRKSSLLLLGVEQSKGRAARGMPNPQWRTTQFSAHQPHRDNATGHGQVWWLYYRNMGTNLWVPEIVMSPFSIKHHSEFLYWKMSNRSEVGAKILIVG